MVRGLTSAAADNTADAERLYTLLTGPQREALTRRLAGAAAQGQLRADADLGTVAEAIIGHLLYRQLTDTTHHSGSSLIDILVYGIIVR